MKSLILIICLCASTFIHSDEHMNSRRRAVKSNVERFSRMLAAQIKSAQAEDDNKEKPPVSARQKERDRRGEKSKNFVPMTPTPKEPTKNDKKK